MSTNQQNPAGTAAFCGGAMNIDNVDINKTTVNNGTGFQRPLTEARAGKEE
jgi:hypothetical protein